MCSFSGPLKLKKENFSFKAVAGKIYSINIRCHIMPLNVSS